jgi:ribosomal protein S18 acetylase RimI-like enzyme
MPRIAYVERRFSERSRQVIEHANSIIAEYQRQGFTLTLRQLYYQFVARDLIANKQSEYKRLGSIINDARLAGQIDWLAIEDRTRGVTSWAHWASPTAIVEESARQFEIDKWARQPWSIEVWIEKEALAGVFRRVCADLDVPYLSCRGYTSQSEMWRAARRLQRAVRDGRRTMILHFGDHDPSGIDMTRDIIERLRILGASVQVERLALNMDQVEAYGPPPNPAKITDSRFDGYMRVYGDESWELDALEPRTLADLVEAAVLEVRDEGLWSQAVEEEHRGRAQLEQVADRWDEIVDAYCGPGTDW